MPKFTHIIELRDYASAPAKPGIYEIGFWVEPNFFVPRYIGRARGRLDGDDTKPGTTIRSRLSAHYNGRGSKPIARAQLQDIDAYALYDPDLLTETGRQKIMAVHDDLHCRYMVTSSAASREANLLNSCGITQFDQYVWNRRRENAPIA